MPAIISVATRQAYAAFYKATWNQAWAAAGITRWPRSTAAGTIGRRRLEHLDQSLRSTRINLRATNLCAMVLRKLGQTVEAEALLQRTRRSIRSTGGRAICSARSSPAIRRPGWTSRSILPAPASSPRPPNCSTARASDRLPPNRPATRAASGTAPLVHYTSAGCTEGSATRKPHSTSSSAPPPRRPTIAFRRAWRRSPFSKPPCAANPKDARAPYYLGNLLYDRRRHDEAIRLWERSARLDPAFSVVWRNLGIGYFNIRHNAEKARTAYDRAFRANPSDARLLFERDQLWKRLGEKPAKRLRAMEKRLDLVRQRDDLSVELCALYNQTGRHADALALLSSRRFQPWEGGEGGPLGQWVRSHLALGRAALSSGLAAKAREHFEAALTAPHNLGEAKHLLANQSDIHYWLGRACDALGDKNSARQHWLTAATFKGDFQEMSVRAFSEMTYYSAWSWERLGQTAKATKLFADLLAYAQNLQKTPARIDYFATSLPTMLLFDDDLQVRQETTALFLQAQAHLGLKRRAKAKRLLAQVLKRDPSHALAADLLAELKGVRSGGLRRDWHVPLHMRQPAPSPSGATCL